MRTRRFDTLTYARSGARSRGHHAVRPQAAPQHRGLRVEGEAGAARAVLQRRRPRRLRRPRLRHRRRGRRPTGSGSTGARGCASRCARSSLGTLTLRLADSLVVQSIVSDEFGRLFGLRVKNQNTLVVNLPAPLDARQRADADDRLRRPARAADARPRDARAARAGPAARRSDDQPMLMHAGAELPLQQPQLLVSAGAGHRLRHGDASASPCRRRSTASRAASCEPGFPRLLPAKEPAQTAQGVLVHRRAAAALPRVPRQPLRRAPRPRRSRFDRDGRARRRRRAGRRRLPRA